MSPRSSPRAATGLLLVAAVAVAGCASHSDRTREARSALDAGQPKRALALYNEALEVERAEQLPGDLSGDKILFVLDRAIVLQQLDRYDLSSRDLRVADKQIEILDFSRGAGAELGRYLFSDSSGAYKAPPYEKLMINTMNLVNFLVRGDLSGGRVEARRLAVMQKYLSERKDPSESLLGAGSYLAGFAFEKSGRPQEALRWYDEALGYGRYPSLAEPVRRLAGSASYRSPRIRELLGEQDQRLAPAPRSPTEPEDEPESPEEPVEEGGAPSPDAEEKKAAAPSAPRHEEMAELLVIVSFGRVPAKVAKRVPIGLALTWVSGDLAPHDRQRAGALAAQGLVTWVNYPELGKARGQYDIPEFAVGGRWQRLDGIVAVDQEAQRAWERAKGAVIGSAITRLIARFGAGEIVRRGSGGGALGMLLGLTTQASMVAADTPDTRSWSTLPARMAFGRVWLPPGTHSVWLGARGVGKAQKVTLKKGGYAVVNLTVLH
jgi:tetratricopeptide (TPR) repeat protein